MVPVTDVDRATDFYTSLGWRLDADFIADDDLRVVQLTLPGSACSVIFGRSVTDAAPGLPEACISSSRTSNRRGRNGRIAESGSARCSDSGGVFHHADSGRVPSLDPERRSYASFATFDDPDGNEWFLQEITERLPRR